MIRKPTEAEFQDGMAVAALRETKKIAQGAQKGVQKGIASLWIIYFFGILGFGILMPLLLASPGLIVLGVVFFIGRNRKKLARGEGRFKGAFNDSGNVQPPNDGRYRLETSALAQHAVTPIICAAIIFFLGSIFSFSSFGPPLFLAAMTLMVLAILIGARIFGDRTALEINDKGLTTHGLLKSYNLGWDDVDDVFLHSFSWIDLLVFFTIGTRHALVIKAERNRMGGSNLLLVPVTMFGLNRDDVETLVTCIANNVTPPNRQKEPVPKLEPVYRPPPVSDALAAFDPDAIMARYLKERGETVAVNRPDLMPAQNAAFQGSKIFGRKIA